MKNYIKVILILLLPLVAVGIYSQFADTWNMELQKARIDGLGLLGDSLQPDTLRQRAMGYAETVAVDTASQRILFVGDSMVEGLGPRMAEYCTANGHDLTYVCWYSSTTQTWDSDTLRHYIRQVEPTFVIVTIGGNEQQTRDMEGCEKHVRSILEIIGDVPCFWISTPAWNKEAAFNDIPQRVFGEKRFFDSRKLTYERGSDHRHPTFAAARMWMDSIATWMSSPRSAHPIRMDVPPEGTSNKCHAIYLKLQKDGSLKHEEHALGMYGADRKPAAQNTPASPARPASPAAAPAKPTIVQGPSTPVATPRPTTPARATAAKTTAAGM